MGVCLAERRRSQLLRVLQHSDPDSRSRPLNQFLEREFMKTSITRCTSPEAGYALPLVIIFAGVSLVILASTLSWTSSGVRVTERNNAYNRAVSAAEASVESVVARMDRDFLNKSLDKNLL